MNCDRMKCAVIVMATLMIIASMLLVGVSLAMAEHIDELGIVVSHMIVWYKSRVRFIYDKGPWATDTPHKQYNNNYTKYTGYKDEQAYNASYTTTQNNNIV